LKSNDIPKKKSAELNGLIINKNFCRLLSIPSLNSSWYATYVLIQNKTTAMAKKEI
jgi:hypothetical protein